MSPLSRPSGAALFALAAVAGCASSKPATAPAPAAVALSVADAITATTPDSVSQLLRGVAPGAPRVRSDRSVLSRDEIRATQFPNMYDVVLSLRGNWVRIRTADSFGTSSVLQVYLDQQRLSGGVDELRQMNPTNVESVRFFDPIAASARWGLDHGAGALLITTSKR